MLKKQLTIATLFLASASVWAAQPSLESVERLMKIQQFDQLMEGSLKNFASTSAIQLITSDPKYKESIQRLPNNKRIAIENKLHQYVQQEIAILDNPKTIAEIRQATIDTMRSIYTQEEIDAMIKFYGSAVGQSINSKIPKYMQAMTSSPLFENLKRDLAQSAEQSAPKLKRDINQIVCGKDECKKQSKKVRK
ncbi:MAG: DUF2059 domain-containing protein [Neisseria sp.]|uniref:DUF2059 domain-containing protein n=1 Tax=Neisseria sp. TaxID=192066 RepID=UPI0026DB5E5E|nr:DUF2059 domain-containing protein [Neisseria sp.]MDO4641098.1 DUF2059 domain-containing protein [Neisseria sp.]